MIFCSLSSSIIIYLITLLAMAFFTLLERKILGYAQTRKGPNKVGIIGIPQPLADAAKLFLKEIVSPLHANIIPFIAAPTLGLLLALLLWTLYPNSFTPNFFSFGVLIFLCVSSLNVYTTLGAGWTSNSKYALIGALRGMAQTISYEISIALILLSPLFILTTFNFSLFHSPLMWTAPLIFPLLYLWFTTCLAETNRTPFDLAEGESELVSGFNTEYAGGTFALIFMAEYTNILVIRLFTALFFLASPFTTIFSPLILSLKTSFFATLFIWTRGTLPRLRYDQLINLTWKCFLPLSITFLFLLTPSFLFWYCAGLNG